MVVGSRVVGPAKQRTHGPGRNDVVHGEQLQRSPLDSEVLPLLPLPHATNVGASPTKRSVKSTERTSSGAPTTPTTNNSRAPTPTTNNSRTPTPTTNNSRSPTPTTLPPLTPTPTPTTSNRTQASTSVPPHHNPPAPFHCKLTQLQAAALLKPFWADLLANQIKQVRKHLVENHLKTIDFNTARYAANADATPLHLCAQYGLLAMAKMLVRDFGFAATLSNKVGSTPLHVACKWAQNDVVSWLIDDLRVPLDVPDGQNRTALDVAPFDTVDTCVLAPLYQEHGRLLHREAVLMEENRVARERLDHAQLVFRQQSMALADTESHLEEHRMEIVEVRDLARHWHDQWLAREAVLDDIVAQYDARQQELVDEEQKAQDLYDQEVRAVHDEHLRIQRELEEMETLVESTQHELDHRRQLLVDQLGVFDASLREYRGSKEVQQWALATLLAIAHDDSSDGTPGVNRTELLLRSEPVDVVRHVLEAFPTDYELQYEALEVLVAVLRLHARSSLNTYDLFVAAVVDSDLLLQLGGVIARWFSNAEKKLAPDKMTMKVFEALYLCLGLRKNTQRILALCQHNEVQLKALQVLEKLSSTLVKASSDQRSLMGYAALFLLTQVKYGVKNILLKAGVVRIILETLQRISADPLPIAATSEDDTLCMVDVEIAQYLFASLALLLSSSSTKDTHMRMTWCGGKSRELELLEDVTADAACIHASIIIDCVRVCVLPLPYANHRFATIATLWAFKLLANIACHGGETALRVRQELLDAVPPDDHDSFLVLAQAINLALTAERSTELENQAVLAGLDTFRVVWIERFDHEGRILPSRVDVIKSLPGFTASLIERVLASSIENGADILVDLAASLDALTSAAQNPNNAAHLASHDLSIDTTVLRPILQWTFRFVDETGTSYREPHLLILLGRGLKLFLLLTQARRASHSLYLHTASASELAGFHRELHTQSHATGICAVLKVFREISSDEAVRATPPEWRALLALCVQIEELLHCTC